MKTGVLASYRDKFLYLKEKVLTDELFILYEYCIHLADFDENHKGKFGTFQKTSNKELGQDLGWSEDKVGRNINALLKKELLKVMGGKQIEVVDYFRFLPKNAFSRVKNGEETAYLQENITKMRFQNAELRQENANLQNKVSDLTTNYASISDIVSSKVNSSLLRTEAEYQEMLDSGQFPTMTIDDMKWIDKNIS